MIIELFWGPEPQIQIQPTNPVDEEEDPDPDLVAYEPPFSASSEDSVPEFRRTGTQESDSGFNPISEDSHSHQSATYSPTNSVSTPRQGTSKQAYDSPSSPEEFRTPPHTLPRQR